MKKAISYITSFVMMLALLFMPNMQAYASGVSIGVSASTVNIGDSVTVTVSVPDGITATIDLVYSSDIVSFSGASAEVGANGSNVRINIGKLSPAGSTSVSVTFKANTSGTASFSASAASAVDDNTVEDVALSGASASVTVANQAATQPTPPPAGGGNESGGNEEAPKSADNSLASLKLSSGTLSPSFKYNVTNYTATVGYNVSNVVVSATPSNGKATIESVTGNGNVNLEVGENTVQVVVMAENGVKATYTVVITRLAEGEGDTPDASESQSSETEDTPVREDVLQWNGQTLTPTESVPNDVVPADFSASTIVINSVETPCLTFANGNLTVLYLANEEGTEGLYIYDEAQQVVYPFVKLEAVNNYVMVLLPDEANAPAPESYKACTLSIEGKGVIHAYQFMQSTADAETTGWFAPETFYAAEPVATDFYLIYCMSNSGEMGWYVYDSVEGTIQRYLGLVHTPVVEQEGTVDDSAENQTDYDKLVAELETAKNMQMIIIAIAVFVVVVLVIVIVNLILRNRSDEDFDDEDFDDDDEEYYDEYEFEEDVDTTEEVNVVETLDETDDEIEIEFYEMPQEEVNVEPVVEDEEDDDEVEIEFYEMTEEVTEEDEVEVEFYNMEDLLVQEAIAPVEETSKEEKTEIPVKKAQAAPAPVQVKDTYTDDDDDDDDLEFIELD